MKFSLGDISVRFSLGDISDVLEGIGANIYLTYPTTEFLGGGGQEGQSRDRI